jgi:hypothetical protein
MGKRQYMALHRLKTVSGEEKTAARQGNTSKKQVYGKWLADILQILRGVLATAKFFLHLGSLV